jgi:transcription elongation factor Elf1
MTRCPFCGSDKISRKDEPENSKTIHKGLPEHFTRGKWSYFVCEDCFQKSTDETSLTNRSDIDFVFTVVCGRIFLYIGNKSAWVESDREVVQFT